MNDNGEPNRATPDDLSDRQVQQAILAELRALRPAVHRMQRAPWWLTWLALGLAAAVAVIGITLVAVYVDNRHDDQVARDQRRADIDAQLEHDARAACEQDNTQNAKVRAGFEVLIRVVSPDSPAEQAAVDRLRTGLDATLTDRDCTAEARARGA